jgi:tetratricopeptide (TPR) repeat protein
MHRAVKPVALWTLAVAISIASRAIMLPHALRAESFGKYSWASEEIVSGRDLGERRLDFSPFYLDIHVAARRVLDDPRTALIVAQLALGAGASILLYAAASASVGGVFALVAPLAYSAYGTLIAYEASLEPEAVTLFLLAAALALALRGRGRLAAVGLGLACGLAAATRPNALLVAPFALAAMLVRRAGPAGASETSDDRIRDWRLPPAQRLAFFAIGLCAGLALLALALSGGGGGLTAAMSGGQVFHQGTNPEAKGAGVAYPPIFYEMPAEFMREGDYAHEMYREIAAADLGRPTSAAESDRLWRARAQRFMTLDPQAYAALERRKAILFVSGEEFHDVPQAVPLAQRARAFAPLSFAILASLGIAGAVVGAARLRTHVLPLGMLASYLASALILFVSSRQRLPATLPLAFFTAVGIAWCLREAHRVRALAFPAVSVAVALVPILAAEPLRGYRADFAALRASEKLVARARNEYDRGRMAEYRRLALETAVWSPGVLEQFVSLDSVRAALTPESARRLAESAAADLPAVERAFYTGRLFAAAALDSAAEVELRGLEKHAWFGPDAAHLRARSLARLGREEEAIDLLAARAFDSLRGGALLAALIERRFASPDSSLRERLVSLHGATSAAYERGRAFVALEDWSSARRELAFVAERLPQLTRARLLLASCHAHRGDDSAAVAEYEAALDTDPTAHLAIGISAAYRRLYFRGEVFDALQHARWGEALLNEGNSDAAARVLTPLLGLEPWNRDVRTKLARALVEAGRLDEARTVALPLTQSR